MSTHTFVIKCGLVNRDRFALVCDSPRHRGSRYLTTAHHKPQLFPSAEAAILAGVNRSWNTITNPFPEKPDVITTCINCRNTS